MGDRYGLDRWLSRVRLDSADPGRAILLIAVSLVILAGWAWVTAPIWQVTAVPGVSGKVTWIEAASSGFTRRAATGDLIRGASARDAFMATGPRQYSLEFERPAQSDTALSVYVPVALGPAEVFINRVPREGPADPRNGASGILLARPIHVETMPADFHPAANRIDLIMPPGGRLAGPGSVILAPTRQVAAAVDRQSRLAQILPRLAGLVGGAGVLVGLGRMLFARTRRRVLALVLVSLLTATNVLPLAVEAGVAALTASQLGLILAAALAIATASAASPQAGSRRVRAVLLAGIVVWMILVLMSLPLWPTSFATVVGPVTFAMTIGVLLSGLIWTARRLLRSGTFAGELALPHSGLAGLTVLLALNLACRLIDLPATLTVSLEFLYATGSLAILSVGLLAGSFGLSGDAMAAWERRRSLANLVRDQKALISEQTDIIGREGALRAVLEERERLTRDIHDGIGGQLFSLLVRVRSGKINNEQIEAEIEEGLRDLRLIVTSLDHAPTALSETLSVVHSRLKQQVTGAGKVFSWASTDPITNTLRPDQVLNLLRILQESVTNALRHAEATGVCIEIEGEGPDHRLKVIVRDDGSGFDPDGKTMGIGLSNIRRRAASMGASIQFGSGSDGCGTQLCLILPWPPK